MIRSIDDVPMTPTGRTRGPVAMGALALAAGDTYTTDDGTSINGPGVVSLWRFASGRVVGQVERPGGEHENLPAVEVTR